MALTLHLHPLASYCQKVLTALYESGTHFTPSHVDLGDPASRAAFLRISPTGKMPALEDHARNRVVLESTIIIEYLDLYHRGAVTLVPDDRGEALEVRTQDRLFDLYVHDPVQRIVADRIRPPTARDPYGVGQWHAALRSAYEILEPQMQGREWAAGREFSLADCAAGPALFFANEIEPFGAGHPQLAAYLQRLLSRPSFARAHAEAEPWMRLFPR